MSIKVLFLSRCNAARSQIAEYLLNQMGRGMFEASSAGSTPGPINPLAIRALEEVGINAGNAFSKPLEVFSDASFDYVINICEVSTASCDGCRPDCPALPHITSSGCWGFGSPPSGEDEAAKMAYLRKVREQLTNRLRIWMPVVDRPHRESRDEGKAIPA